MTDLIETHCRCGVLVMTAPRSTIEALCMQCRMDDTGAVANYDPAGVWHPSVGYAAPGQGELYVRESTLELPPPPVVTSREVPSFGIDIPAPVEQLAGWRTFGWLTKIQYSRGYATKYRGAWQEEELFAVRFARDGYGAFAVYRTIAGRNSWTWRDVWIWGEKLLPYGKANTTDLKIWLRDGGRVADAWYREITARRVEQDQARRKAAATRTAKPKEVG